MANEKILVVDDSVTELDLMSTYLRDQGYRVTTAMNGEEALQKVEQEQPHLILLDIVMPKKNGFQVCRALKTMPETKDIKIILVSSKNQESDRFWGFKQGADAYMAKPYREEELLHNIVELL